MTMSHAIVLWAVAKVIQAGVCCLLLWVVWQVSGGSGSSDTDPPVNY